MGRQIQWACVGQTGRETEAHGWSQETHRERYGRRKGRKKKREPGSDTLPSTGSP